MCAPFLKQSLSLAFHMKMWRQEHVPSCFCSIWCRAQPTKLMSVLRDELKFDGMLKWGVFFSSQCNADVSYSSSSSHQTLTWLVQTVHCFNILSKLPRLIPWKQSRCIQRQNSNNRPERPRSPVSGDPNLSMEAEGWMQPKEDVLPKKPLQA